MRKSARRQAVKTPQPSVPIIPTSNGKPPVKRPCWYCGNREAVDFGQLYHPTVSRKPVNNIRKEVPHA